MRLLAAIGPAIATLIACSNVAAAATPDPTLEQARGAVARGDLAEGERLLATIDPQRVDPNDLDFLQGTIDVAKGEYAAAVARFKAILNRDGTLNRVRLDLARAYFLKGDDVAATYHFRAAAAQGVPPEVQRNITAFLDQIRRRNHWDVSVGVAIAPDSNINAATTAQSVDLFGIPFRLNDAARQTSGVGLSANLAGTYQWDLAANTKLKAGAAYSGTEYANALFSDRNLAVFAGPRFLFGQETEITVLGMRSRRWYGGQPLNRGAGARVEGQAVLSPRLLVNGTISAQQLDYDRPYEAYTGPVLAMNAALTYALDARSFLRGLLGVVHEGTRLKALRDTQYTAGAGYYTEKLPAGFTAYAEVRVTAVRYEAPLAAFGVTRRDSQIDTRLALSNKRVDVWGFTPVVSYIHTARLSNIDLYAYGRDRFEFGVVRNF